MRLNFQIILLTVFVICVICFSVWIFCEHKQEQERKHHEQQILDLIPGAEQHRFNTTKISAKDAKAAKAVRDAIVDQCGSLDALPKFNPSLYNDVEHESNNNCYEYAFSLINTKSFGKPQPGQIAKLRRLGKGDLNCKTLKEYIKADHPSVKYVEKFATPCPCGFYKVALIVDTVSPMEQRDYHFLRQDNTGIFSHKPGGSAISLLDKRNRYIINPEESNFDYSPNGPNYCTDCGFICVKHDKEQVYEDSQHPLNPNWEQNIPVDYVRPQMQY
jgi:hypothetical protein